ncbi:MAG TPA: transposase [Thermoanaerobaculia bacterium]|nr:transposase [Thermoanaerobaculia bacterium]
MARKLRYVNSSPSPTLVFVTCRTLQGRYLFRPGPELNDLFLGILGRVQRRYQMGLCALCVMSTHLHLLLIVEDARQLSRFMRDLKSKLAREVNRLTGWRGTVFDRRYDSAVVTDEEGAQIERLLYILSHGCKEGLVEKPQDWPGVHCANALLEGETLTGHWFNRSREYAARNQRQDFDRLRYATEEAVTFSPIPCWAHLPPEVYRTRIKTLVDSVITEAAITRSSTDRTVEGVESILSRDPQTRPAKLARSPAPLVHAATKAARKAFYEAYSWFVAAFRSAAEKLKRGDREARFPAGSFPPGLPFVAG